MKTIEDVWPIDTEPVEVTDIRQLDDLVEMPLLATCRGLFERNIRTYMSSANSDDLSEGRPAWILFEFSSLSAENQAVATECCQVGSNRCYALMTVPLVAGMPVETISAQFMEVVDRFVDQPSPGPQALTLESLRDVFELLGEIYEFLHYDDLSVLTPRDFIANGFEYDPETGIFIACPPRPFYLHQFGIDW